MWRSQCPLSKWEARLNYLGIALLEAAGRFTLQGLVEKKYSKTCWRSHEHPLTKLKTHIASKSGLGSRIGNAVAPSFVIIKHTHTQIAQPQQTYARIDCASSPHHHFHHHRRYAFLFLVAFPHHEQGHNASGSTGSGVKHPTSTGFEGVDTACLFCLSVAGHMALKGLGNAGGLLQKIGLMFNL